jgi:regulator of sigma E protease
MLTALIFAAILIVLILSHELGHFVTAKLFGIRVDEFGLGFPPRIASVTKGETTYSLNALFLGGFVKIFGEEGEGNDDPRSFISQKAYVRLIITFAGVCMNMILAGILLSVAFYIGVPHPIGETKGIVPGQEIRIQVAEVAKNSPAETAGIKGGDIIKGATKDGIIQEFLRTTEVQSYTASHKGQTVILTLKRGKELLQKEIALRENPPENEGVMGVSLVETAIVQYSIAGSFVAGFSYLGTVTRELIMSFVNYIANAVNGRPTEAQVGGPVRIAQMTRDVIPLGVPYILNFAAVLSITLAVINALPFPALDGGRALFIAIEKIRGGKRIEASSEATAHMIGFFLLIALMVIITFNDILRLFTS